jgi:Zn ribbon nucleic-acid-binding protein
VCGWAARSDVVQAFRTIKKSSEPGIVNMIRLEALQLRRLAADVLRQLDVEATAQVLDVRELTDGTWMVDFEDSSPDTRFPGFAIDIQQDWSPEQATRELRLELRHRLWICPLCQRRSQIRRVTDRDVFRVECGRCGRFEIESGLLDDFRVGHEDDDQSLVNELPRLAELVGRTKGMPFLTADNWRSLARPRTS